jgi:protein involved in polysaccharide export with SLBB domain
MTRFYRRLATLSPTALLAAALVVFSTALHAQPTSVQRLQLAGQANTVLQQQGANTGADPNLSGIQPSMSGYTPSLPPTLVPELPQGAAAQPLPPPVPSHFQRFVQQSTGRMLPVYGAKLFSRPDTFTPVTNITPPANYIMGPGDELQLTVWGAFDMAVNLVVDSRGQVNIPRVGTVSLAGISVGQLEPTLRGHMGKVFTNIDVAATVTKLRSIQVYVVGQAQRPGTYTLSSLSTVVSALFASGGPNANGSMRAIQLRRGGQLVATVDLYDFIAQGKNAQDMHLQAGDAIVIPPAGPRVAIAGAYDHAAIYELADSGRTVADVLALGGGVPKLATPQIAVLERINPQDQLPRVVQEITLADLGLQTPLADGDVLTLLPISPAFANAVTLKGAVAQPIRRAWQPGLRLLDIIPSVQALLSPDFVRAQNAQVQMARPDDDDAPALRFNRTHINWDYAVIERINPQTLQTELVPFNLGLLLQGDAQHNLLLQAGDVVSILSHTDLRMPQYKRSRLVRVEGEVAAPGVYEALPGETLPQLIRRIGGLTEQAYVFGTEFTREEVRRQQQANLDKLVARLESSLQSQSVDVAANLGAERAEQAVALAQMQRQAQQQQLNRLRTLRSNGRVALELPPRDVSLAALPPVPLEDGDRIVVPTIPSFVAAFGAVNNENVFVHRPGRRVADVLRLAGLTEDAEPAQAFVLRADGTVVARRDRGFGNSFDSLELMPGDTVVVPYKVDRESRWSFITRGLKDWTQILANLGLGVAAWRSL